MNRFKLMFEALMTSQRRFSDRLQVAKHLSKVLLFSLKGKQTLVPEVLNRFERLEKRMAELKKPIWLVEPYRSAAKQNNYYVKGRSKPGKIITNAKGLQSYHQYGLAFDVAFKRYKWNPPSWDWWTVLGREGEKLDLIWGGSFKDYGHFEWHPGFTFKDLEPYFKL